jgi:glycosyltransferase involved in cell wall biosynthesis
MDVRGLKTFLPPKIKPDRASTPLTELPDPSTLRVVLLSDAIPSRNGVGTYYDDLADHLQERVEEVTLLCPPMDPDEDEHFEGIVMVMPGDFTQRLYWPYPWKLWPQIRDLRPHVIVSGTPGGFGIQGLLYAALLRTSFCIAFHTEMEHLASIYWTGRLQRIYKHVLGLWDRMVLRFGSNVLVMNKILLDQALAWGIKDPRVMGTPIQKSFLSKPLAPLDPEVSKVTYVGRLAPEKELVQIYDAAREFPSLHFRLAGEGPLRAMVEKWATELPNLEYVGWISRDQVIDLLDETDLLVLPSRFETFGTVAFEAMVRRRLVMTSAHCGIVRWPRLSPGLFAMAESEVVSQALPRLLAMSSEDRAALAQRGMEGARELAEETVEDWVEVLQQAVLEKRFA